MFLNVQLCWRVAGIFVSFQLTTDIYIFFQKTATEQLKIVCLYENVTLIECIQLGATKRLHTMYPNVVYYLLHLLAAFANVYMLYTHKLVSLRVYLLYLLALY